MGPSRSVIFGYMDLQLLPCVEWKGHRITRLVLGHNPMKGWSHTSPQLDAEMRAWFAPECGNDLAMMQQAEARGINTFQFGGPTMHDRLRRYKVAGGRNQWIATLYDSGMQWNPGAVSFEAELREILAMDPKPIGILNFGENSDRYFLTGNMALLKEKMKRLRDTGLLVGVCTHLPEVVEYIEEQGWDVDFYQTCFYTVYSFAEQKRVDRSREVYEDAARERMVKFIQGSSKPCIAFKILAARRKCGSDQELRAAFKFALDHIRPTDVICVGMWNRDKDQVTQNVSIVRELLRAVDW